MDENFKYDFATAIQEMSAVVRKIAKDHGFAGAERAEAEAIALMHSELSEALESIRKGHPPDHHCPQFTNTEIEYADAIIRILDNGAARGYRIAEAVIAKVEFNDKRPFKHRKEF